MRLDLEGALASQVGVCERDLAAGPAVGLWCVAQPEVSRDRGRIQIARELDADACADRHVRLARGGHGEDDLERRRRRCGHVHLDGLVSASSGADRAGLDPHQTAPGGHAARHAQPEPGIGTARHVEVEAAPARALAGDPQGRIAGANDEVPRARAWRRRQVPEQVPSAKLPHHRDGVAGEPVRVEGDGPQRRGVRRRRRRHREGGGDVEHDLLALARPAVAVALR